MKIYWNGESKNIIGNRLKELRKSQGISQKILLRLKSLPYRNSRIGFGILRAFQYTDSSRRQSHHLKLACHHLYRRDKRQHIRQILHHIVIMRNPACFLTSAANHRNYSALRNSDKWLPNPIPVF